MRLRGLLVLLVASFLPGLLSAQGGGGAIRNLPGFSATSMPRGDSESSGTSLGFNVNFQGRIRGGVYINTNGSLTLDLPLENYSPDPLRRLSREILAGFLADIDTRSPNSGTITYGRDTVNGRPAFGANYINVGYADTKADKLNRFQILIIERGDTGANNFDVEYNYEAIAWESGDGQGRNGFGGISARAGFAGTSGNPGTFYEIPGSGISGSFLDGANGLTRRSFGSNVPGRFVFQFRDGRVAQEFTPTPTTVNFTYAIGQSTNVAQTVVVNSTLPGIRFDVATTLTTGGPWLTILNPTLVTPANLSLALNTAILTPGNYVGNITLTPDPDSGLAPQTVRVNLTVTGQVSITPNPENCTYRFTPGSVTITGAQTNVSVDVRTQPGCPWVATTPANWINFRVPNGTGDGQLLFTATQNGAAARSAVLTVARQAVTVIQAPFIPGAAFLSTCRISSFAGTGVPSFSQDNVTATSAAINAPQHIFVDRLNNLYIIDNGNLRVRRVGTDGVITTVAGNGFDGFTGDGGPATAAPMVPSAGAVDAAGNLYIADGKYHIIRRVGADGAITRVAGSLERGNLGAGVPGLAAQFDGITGMATDRSGNLYIADSNNNLVRRLDSQGILSLFAGNGQPGSLGDGDLAILARSSPRKVAVDPLGNVYIAEPESNRVRRVTPQGIIQPFAGSGTRGNGGDGGQALFASFNQPSDVAVDNQGNVYIADTGNHRIRRVNPLGILEPFAGRGNAGFNGDGGFANDALLNNPQSVTADSLGNVYIADTNNNRVRRVTCEFPDLGLGPRLTGIVNAANFQPVIAPNSFVTITGESLTTQTLTWDSAIGSDGRLPTELGGVRVRINGRPAYVYFVSPTQVNVLTPPETATGTLPVEVTTARGLNILPVEVRTAAPAFFSQVRAGRTYPVAVFANETTLVAEPGSIPGADTRAARPGDFLVLYATGLGLTSPEAPAGQVLTTTYPLANPNFRVTIGGVPAPVQFTGLVFAGVYQINIRVPAGLTASGDLPIVIDLGGNVTSPANAVLSVAR